MTISSRRSKSPLWILVPFLTAVLVSCLCAPSASAQNVPFTLSIQDQNSNLTTVANGATITLSADSLGHPVTVQLVMTYAGLNQAGLTSGPNIVGSAQFTTGSFAPVTLLPGGRTQVSITYTPTSTSLASGQLSIPFTETNPTTGAVLGQGLIQMNLNGTAPGFIVTYALPSNQNTLELKDGDTLTFPATQVGANSSVAVGIANRGSGPGTINAINVTGAAFQKLGVPLLPGSVAANGVLQVTVQYTPTAGQQDQGTLQVVFPDHTVNITLAGSGTAPVYVYQLTQNGQTTTITPNQPAAVANVNVGSSGTFSVTVTNSGNAPGIINSVQLSGAGFQFTNQVPVPPSLAVNASLTFPLVFSPPQAGSFTGFLRIGNDTLTLTGQGLGPQLTYSYTNAAGTTNLQGNALVLFSPLPVGQSSNNTFNIQNSGTAAATVISIGITQPNTAFTLKNVPSQPLSIPPSGTASFTIVFSPNALGTNQASLQIDSQVITLSGAGTAPPAIPSYQFSGASGAQQPLQQPSIGLTLASPYALPLTGTLTLTQAPVGFTGDPSVQFETGGLVAAFTIPANSTQAVFSNNTNSLRLQTGSVAGTITITPSFATSGINLTPPSPTTLQMTVAAGPPKLTVMVVSGSNPTGFNLQITGVVTSKTLSEADFTFTPAPKYNLAASTVTIDLSSLATAWFTGSQSTAFGGQFTISVPFSLTTTDTSLTSPIQALQSVSVTLKNSLGTSNSLTSQLQ